jgi:hypothetical protein
MRPARQYWARIRADERADRRTDRWLAQRGVDPKPLRPLASKPKRRRAHRTN